MAPFVRFLLVLIAFAPTASCARASSLTPPLSYLSRRPVLISFRLYVSPKTSPLPRPEPYSGYHTGTDFELLPGEEKSEVPVYAACSGTVIFSGYAKGYGGVLSQSCMLNDAPVTVVYGHLALSSLLKKGTTVKAGQQIAILASAYSRESGGARKHLHFDIHRGASLVLLGYVQKEADLGAFIDPLTVLQR